MSCRPPLRMHEGVRLCALVLIWSTKLYSPILCLTSALLLHRHQQQVLLWRWAPHSLPARKQLSQGRASLVALAQAQPPLLQHQGLHWAAACLAQLQQTLPGSLGEQAPLAHPTR